jgi:hypothetical protein
MLQMISPPSFKEAALREEIIPAEVDTIETPNPLRTRGISV